MATTTNFPGPRTTGKVRPHQTQNESLIFEKSSPGKRAYKLPPLDVPPVDVKALLGPAAREVPGLLPELSEIEIIRHFTRLSTWNYAIDLGMYPLGSCTMKYNPRVNEAVSRIEGLAEAHPYRPDSLAQGILEVIDLLQRCLIEITGMDAITLQPAAGAHGEFTGILLVRAWHESQGNARKKILIPDSAHGTNPATAAICGYQVENLKSNSEGGIDLEALAAPGRRRNRRAHAHQPLHHWRLRKPDPQDRRHSPRQGRAALYGRRQHERACRQSAPRRLRRRRDAPQPAQNLLNTPWRRRSRLRPRSLQSIPRALPPNPSPRPKRERCEVDWDYDRPHSVGRVRAFYGNTGMFIRALAYILANGPDGLRQTTEDAVLNANYIRNKLEDIYELPYKTASMHEVVFSDKRQAALGVKTGDIAKRLIDYGFHPYTVSFPMIVHGALMIEPTESESLEELDLFIAAMRSIAKEVEETPDLVKTAPHSTRVSRLDEVQAARKPILRWKPARNSAGRRHPTLTDERMGWLAHRGPA